MNDAKRTATYNFEMAERLTQASKYLLDINGDTDYSTCQAVIYMSLMSVEVALKSILEASGFSKHHLRKMSHDLQKLLSGMCFCEMLDVNGRWQSLASIRGEKISHTVENTVGESTIGNLIERLPSEASQYPNEIRYANEFKHYPAICVCDMAHKVITYCSERRDQKLRLKNIPIDEIISRINKF